MNKRRGRRRRRRKGKTAAANLISFPWEHSTAGPSLFVGYKFLLHLLLQALEGVWK